MSAQHNHPPKCCCYSVPLPRNTPLAEGRCPQCPEHGDLASLSRATVKASDLEDTPPLAGRNLSDRVPAHGSEDL